MEKYYTKTATLMRKNKDNNYIYENESFFIDIIHSLYCDRMSLNYKYDQGIHAHSHYEAYIILEGECNLESGLKELYTVKKGEFIVFPTQFKHRITGESDKFKKISITFSFSPKETAAKNFYQVAKKIMETPVVLKTNDQIKHHCNSMIYNIDKKPHDYTNIIFLSTIQLIIETFRIIVSDVEIEYSEAINDNRIMSAIEYIESNISASLNVKKVADYVHLSPKQLVRIFKKEMGITPGEYLKSQRIKCISDMLINGLTPGDIVETMGYSDSTSMIKAYKRFSGTTPSRYIKSLSLKEKTQQNK